MQSAISWTFSQLESGLVRLASDAGHILDMHPVALTQMTAHELLAMLERRAAEAATPPPPAQEATTADSATDSAAAEGSGDDSSK